MGLATAFAVLGLAHPNEELWLPEYGSYEDPEVSGRKGAWMKEVQDTFKSDAYKQFRGIIYFHAYREGTPCEWWADSSTTSIRAFEAMGQDVFYSRQALATVAPPYAAG